MEIRMDNVETLIVVAGLSGLGIAALYFLFKALTEKRQPQVVYQQQPVQASQNDTGLAPINVFPSDVIY